MDSSSQDRVPDNADFELRKAYSWVIEASLPYSATHLAIEGVHPQDAHGLYHHAYRAYRKGNALAAERWARAAKHLSRALLAEARIDYLHSHGTDLPCLEGDLSEASRPPESADVTGDLLNSVAEHVPPGLPLMPETMKRYLARARDHLAANDPKDHTLPLLRAERIRAAYEYGRVLEIMALAFEAETTAEATPERQDKSA
jgi:hypothetical protein